MTSNQCGSHTCGASNQCRGQCGSQHTHTRARARAQTHTRIRTRTRTHAHTRTYTHTHERTHHTPPARVSASAAPGSRPALRTAGSRRPQQSPVCAASSAPPAPSCVGSRGSAPPGTCAACAPRSCPARWPWSRAGRRARTASGSGGWACCVSVRERERIMRGRSAALGRMSVRFAPVRSAHGERPAVSRALYQTLQLHCSTLNVRARGLQAPAHLAREVHVRVTCVCVCVRSACHGVRSASRVCRLECGSHLVHEGRPSSQSVIA